MSHIIKYLVFIFPDFKKITAVIVTTILCLTSTRVPATSTWAGGMTYNSDYSFSYQWAVDTSPPALTGRVQCGVTNCIIGFFSRTGLGKPSSSSGLCDSGGVCLLGAGSIARFNVVRVPNSTPWEDAINIFIQSHGTSGSFKEPSNAAYDPRNPKYKDVAWGALCVGFAVLPEGTSSVSVLAPNSVCGVAPKPTLSCTIDLPSAISFDFGTQRSNQELDLTVSESGSYQCGETATITATSSKSMTLNTLPVNLSINGVTLDNTNQKVASGSQGNLNISARLQGKLTQSGTYTDLTVIVIGYY